MPRLTAAIWTSAIIRRAMGEGAFAALRHKGAEGSSAALVKVSLLDGTAFVLVPVTSADGSRQWMRATGTDPVSDADCERYLDRALARDPDLWVLEIEDRQGRWFFDEPVLPVKS